jgi:flagellar basal body P-ring formation protein FlgA
VKLLIGAFTILLCAKANAAAQIRIRPMTQLSQSKMIYLGDIADFEELSPAVARELSLVKLAAGPNPGEKIQFTGAEISSIIRSRPILSQRLDKPEVQIPSRITVENVGDRPTEAQLRIEIVEHWSKLCGCRIQIDELLIPKVTTWEPGARWQIRFGTEVARGSFNLGLEIKSADKPDRLVWIRGRVSHYKSVPVSQRMLNQGERVQPQDFIMTEREVTFARDLVPGADDIVGRRLRQSLAANDILFTGNLEREKALKRGDSVRVQFSNSGWEVSLMAVADQDGFIGDTVKVRNVKSNQTLMAKVIGQGEVKAE